MIAKYYCFFKTISDLFNGIDILPLFKNGNDYVSESRYLVLLHPIECGDSWIVAYTNKVLYGMVLRFMTELPEDLQKAQQDLRDYDCFKRAILCPLKKIKEKHDYDERLSQAVYFDLDSVSYYGLVHYCYEHHFFTLEELEPNVRDLIEHILERDPFHPFEKAKGPYYKFFLT